MKSMISAAAGAVILLSAVPAFANATSVSCGNYVVAIHDDVAIAGQVLAGSSTAFNDAVCELTAIHANLDNPTQVPVYSPGLNLTTRVMIIPTNRQDDN